ncbi:hypothetical protein CI109_105719 [Kwoniella shandongensis]|uniref:Uncharacterized protein n=1 Tax=Kwoniella shandongensis TaxID=1734106 RepID=A0A5M6C071_9TREE|nr:uncharacterized protein CI109_003059 [Kwoniella shandongensis]KAA5528527.1 hypothetical protein CI109_003059 [Kwoniella shandongensis]
MARSMIDIEDELSRLWGLVGELSEQLSNNRALVTQLKSRSDNVKGQAAHVGTGFPLRRFNLDITNEEFQSELEAFSSHLVLENQQLQHENKQLNALLKEYEQTLETVMGKFRGVAHASQQHDLSLHSYYTSLIQTLQTAHSSAQLHDSTSLSLLLNRLSTLLRSALRSLGGEETDIDLASQLPGLLSFAAGAGGSPSSLMLGRPNDASSSSEPSSPAKSISSLPRAPARPVPFPGSIPGSSGGYAGTEGQKDWAMEREMEILRLEEENKSLRELLKIAEEANLPASSTDDNSGEGGVRSNSDVSEDLPRSRKSSLTIEELEQGAALEADRKEAEAAMDAFDDEHNDEIRPGGDGGGREENHHGEDGQGGEEYQQDKPQRPILNESVLGFQADMPPPEQAIVDEPEGEQESTQQQHVQDQVDSAAGSEEAAEPTEATTATAT